MFWWLEPLMITGCGLGIIYVFICMVFSSEIDEYAGKKFFIFTIVILAPFAIALLGCLVYGASIILKAIWLPYL